jgi:3-oxoadipate enol-lactonase
MTPADTTSTLIASDGTPIVYRVRRSAADAPVIALVHSLAMDHRFWDPVAQRLDGLATVVTIDARGHGRSGRGTLPYTAGGASMGGCVALQFAGDHPDRTAALALIDTTAWYGPSAPKDWEDRATKAMAQGLPSLVEFQKTRWFSDAFRAQATQLVDQSIDIFLANDLQAYVATCRMLGAFDGRGLLSRIRVPTLVIVGEEDYAAPVAMSQLLHQGIAGSRLDVILGARHLTPLEVPDRVAQGLLELCAEVKP